MNRASLRSLRAAITVAGCALACACSTDGWFQQRDPSIQRGNQLYRQQQYQQALSEYRSSSSDGSHRSYNIGAAQYQLARTAHEAAAGAAPGAATTHTPGPAGSQQTTGGGTDAERASAALASFSGAVAHARRDSDLQLASIAHLGRGNALFALERYSEAVAAYKDSLRANPDYDDARYNLEIALRRLQPRQQPGRRPPDSARPQPGQPGQRPEKHREPGSDGAGDPGQSPPGDRREGSADGRSGESGPTPDRSPEDPANGRPGPSADTRDPGQQREPTTSTTGSGETLGDRRPQADAPPGKESPRPPPSETPAPGGEDEPSDSPAGQADRDRKLDALERMSRELHKDKLRRRARDTRTGEHERDW